MPGAGDRVSQVVLVVKNLPANAGDIRDMGLIPELGRSPAGGKGNPLQYLCLENPTDRGALQATVHRVRKKLDTTQPLSTHKCWGYISDQNRQGLHPHGVCSLVREIDDKQLEKLIYEQRL